MIIAQQKIEESRVTACPTVRDDQNLPVFIYSEAESTLVNKDIHAGIVSFHKALDAVLHGILIFKTQLFAKSTWPILSTFQTG